MEVAAMVVLLLKSFCLLPCFAILLTFLIRIFSQSVASIIWVQSRTHLSWLPDSPFRGHHRHHLIEGSSDDYLVKLSISVYEPTASKGEVEEECAVCLCAIEKGNEIRELRCMHLFHRACLDRWVEYKRVICPLCRRALMPRKHSAAPAKLVDMAEVLQAEEEQEDHDDEDPITPLMFYVQSTTWWIW